MFPDEGEGSFRHMVARIIHGTEPEEQSSPIAVNGPLPRGGLQLSVVDGHTAKKRELSAGTVHVSEPLRSGDRALRGSLLEFTVCRRVQVLA